MSDDGRMRVKRLTVENFKRVKIVAMDCDPNWNVVGGRNAQGKSSTLDAIEAAFRGKRAMPADAIHTGAERCDIVCDLDSIVVERHKTAKTDRLVVRTKDGMEARSPQKMLDELWGEKTIDPFEFQRLSSKVQADRMMALLGLDFTDLDERRRTVYAQRTDANRDAKSAQAKLAGMQTYADAPAEEVSIADLITHRDKMVAHNEKGVDLRRAKGACDNAVREASDRVERIMRELADAEDALGRAETDAADAQEALKGFELFGMGEIDRQIETAEETNRKVRANATAAQQASDLKTIERNSANLTTRLEAIDAKKARMVAEAPFPVPGLSFGPDGLMMNDHPFAQASSAEKWRVSIAMGIALNPKLAVLLIRDGEKLDEDSREIVKRMAVESGVQIFVEDCRAGEEEATVIIEDGQVMETKEEANDSE